MMNVPTSIVKPGEDMLDIDLGYVFIGSCTNARLDRLAAIR